jgi:putative transposase
MTGMMTQGGAHKRGLNRAIARSAMATTRRLLGYKTAWAGGRLVVVDRFYPSSKTCSECGATKAKLLLSERTYACPLCGCVIDRDLNAAVNLAKQATAGSGPVAGRGAEQKTRAPLGARATGHQASTSQPHRAQDEDRRLATVGS